jgi:hypothetical protein
LRFLSGLNDEITDVVLLYNQTTLKQAYKLSQQIEKSLNSQSRMNKSHVKPFNHTSSLSHRNLKFKDDKIVQGNVENSKPVDSSTTQPLTIDKKRSLGLCFRCEDKYFVCHK